MRIELITAEQTVFPPGRGDIAFQRVAADKLSRGVAGVGEYKGVCPFLMNEVFQLRGGDGKGLFFFRPHGQQNAAVAQAVEVIFVGGVVGVLVGNARSVRQNGEQAGQREASARSEADVVCRIFRSAPAVLPVDHVGNGFAHFLRASHGAVCVIGGREGQAVDAGGRAGHVADFRLALSEIAPLRVSVPESQFGGFVHNPYDAHVWDIPDHGERG